MGGAASRESRIGQCIGNYRITDELGAGGMGIVYKATDVRLGRAVALKFLPAGVGGNRQQERFLQEARAASSLDHPNIGTIYGIEEAEDGRFFIAMAYYDGETLRDRINGRPLASSQAAGIALQIASGLSAAHAKGIVHRDIKPSNIIITKSGAVKIVDFGLAKLADLRGPTQSGAIVGTAAYMSPEQATGQVVDQRSDLWSLGVVIYEMVAGRLPFAGENSPSMLYAIVNRPPVPLEGAGSQVGRIVSKALTKDPAERYQTAAELIDDLQELSGIPNASTETFVRPAPGGARSRLSRRWIFALIAVALALAIFLASPVRRRLTNWLAASGEKHVAVLPFTNVGGAAADQALCDGLMETLTSKLSGLRTSQGALWVVPSGEVQRRKITDPGMAKRELDATMVITGSVQLGKSDAKLVVNLIDATNLRQIDSAVIDDASGNFAALEDRAVATLAKMLEVSRAPSAEHPSRAAPAAYESYLKGVGYLQRFDKTGNLDAAITAFEDARQSDAQFALAYAGLGKAYWLKSQRDRDPSPIRQATEYSKRAVELDDQLAPPYVILGRIHNAAGQRELAIQEFQRALKLNPSSPDALRGLGLAYQGVGRIGEAEELLQKAQVMEPDSWEGYTMLGIFYYTERRYQDAVGPFRRVIELTPDNVFAYSNLANTYIELENWPAAQKLLQTAIGISPTYLLYSTLGLLYMREHHLAEASAAFEKAVKLNDKQYTVWGNLADSYQYAGDAAKAQTAYRRAVELAESAAKTSPQDATREATLGYFYARVHQREKALIRLQSALALGPKRHQVLTRVAAAYNALGMKQQAIAYAQKALQNGYSLEQLKHSYELSGLLQD